MNRPRATLFAMLLLSATTAIADAALNADRQSVDQACAADAATAGCSGEQAGKGLLKCLDAYRKAHPGTKESESCVSARKQLHAQRKEEKAAKASGTPTAN